MALFWQLSQFYHRHSEMIVKYGIGLQTLLQKGISEPGFYVDLAYNFKISHFEKNNQTL